MTISVFFTNKKIEKTKISSTLPNHVFFSILDLVRVNAIFTTVATITLFKFIQR